MWDGEKCALAVASDAKFCVACGVKLEEHAEPKRSKSFERRWDEHFGMNGRRTVATVTDAIRITTLLLDVGADLLYLQQVRA